jgi:nucleotide-binding universal stress UspA family protein
MAARTANRTVAPMPRVPHCVVVGFDGSEIARATLGLAARRLGLDDRLVVAHVVAVPITMLEAPYYDRALEQSRKHGQRVLEQAKGALPSGPRADLRLVEGPPARTLVELAEEVDADEIAVGSRGFGSFRAAALGSTSHALLHESDRPVLVVTRRAVERELRLAATPGEATTPPTLVVGYDGSDNARAALDYAGRRVGDTGGQVVAVCASYAPSDWLGAPYYQLALDEYTERAREITRSLVDRPDVETDVVLAPPVEALTQVAQARDASEIVVGARGLGRFRAALGSVSHGLLHESDRPVVIVPAGA